MLKAFPSKAAGAAAMLCSMLILFVVPWLDSSIMGCGSLITDPQYKPGFTFTFLVFVTNMLTLGWLGGLAVSDINQVWMQVGTLLYFSYFLIGIPALTYSEWLFLLYKNKLKLNA
jgi:ubiquinol-cytochrome c reductase cytochrome b subunit